MFISLRLRVELVDLRARLTSNIFLFPWVERIPEDHVCCNVIYLQHTTELYFGKHSANLLFEMEEEKPNSSDQSPSRDPEQTSSAKDEEELTPPASSDNDTGDDYEVTWDGEKDPQNPKNLTAARKWLIALTLASGSFCM